MNSSDNNQNTPSPEIPDAVESVVQAPGDAASPARGDARRRSISRWLGAGLVLTLIVIVALAATLRHQQEQLDAFGREAARRLDDIVSRVDQAHEQSRMAAQQSQSLDARLTTLDKRLQALEDQQKTLTQSYRELVHGNDEVLLVNIEQSLMLASEQLQLAGRVPSAIAGLQLAEARMARAGRAAFMPAQQVIARDLVRLQALPILNVADVSRRLDAVIRAVDSLPLATATELAGTEAGTPAPAASELEQGASSVAPDAAWWERAWGPVQDWARELRAATVQELRSLVRVRRIDQPDALLLEPEQRIWIRTNVTLRLLDARMALMARERDVWRADIDAAIQGVERYADLQSPAVQRTLTQLAELRDVDPAPTMPDLEDSLAAVRALLASSEANALDALDDQSQAEE